MTAYVPKNREYAHWYMQKVDRSTYANRLRTIRQAHGAAEGVAFIRWCCWIGTYPSTWQARRLEERVHKAIQSLLPPPSWPWAQNGAHVWDK